MTPEPMQAHVPWDNLANAPAAWIATIKRELKRERAALALARSLFRKMAHHPDNTVRELAINALRDIHKLMSE